VLSIIDGLLNGQSLKIKSDWIELREEQDSSSIIDLHTVIAIIHSSNVPKVHKNKSQGLLQHSVDSATSSSEPSNTSSSNSSVSTIKINEFSNKSSSNTNNDGKDLLNSQMSNLMNAFLNQNFFNVNEHTSSDIIIASTNSGLNLKHDTSIELNESKNCLEENYADKTSKGELFLYI